MKKEIEKIRKNWEDKLLAMDNEMLAMAVGIEASLHIEPILIVIEKRLSESQISIMFRVQEIVADYMRGVLKEEKKK